MEMMAVTIQQNGGIIICNSIFDEIISASLIWIFELFFYTTQENSMAFNLKSFIHIILF